MSIILRPYQDDLINRTRASLRSGKRAPLLVSPCGSGKTVMFSYFAQRVTGNGKRTIILAHRDELIDQISHTLNQFNVAHSFIAAGRYYDRKHKVHVASVFSAVRRLHLISPPDVVIADEAHHCSAGSSWSKVFKAFPKAWRIGVTASPVRLSGEPLGDNFDDMIIGPSTAELIELGALCKYRIFAPAGINTSEIRTRMGDFSKPELAEASDKPTITGDAIRHYAKHAHGKRAIVFCVSIEHAKHVADQFRASGYRATSIDGKLSREIRRNIVSEFRNGGINVLTSCDIISEGFDLPAIEVAIMLRPTQSLALWIQQSGRALRVFPGKSEALILDHAGNTMRHGMPDEEREWSLGGRDSKKNSKADSSDSVRVCPVCFAAQWSKKLVCGNCGHVFVVESREVEEVEGELEEIDIESMRKNRKLEEGKARTFEDFVALGKARNYKSPSGWAYHKMQARQYRKPEISVEFKGVNL